MNQSDSCGDTATSESQEPDVGESQHDPLRVRIAAVQLGHMPDDYERDLGQCRCGFKYQKHWDLASHVADAVIRDVLTPEYLADMIIAAVQKAANND